MATSTLPARFPCWCQATYSWGGESKKDLGFIEGDLIEALNAGDGSWWMGRLRRDPRAIGLFPSNFVKVLNQDFQPAPNNRNASPLPPSAARANGVTGGTFRKPFQAYEKLGPRGSLDHSREPTPESDRDKKKKEKTKFRPYSSMKTAQAPSSTLQQQASQIRPKANVDDRPRIPEPIARRSSKTPSVRPESASRHAGPSPFAANENHVHPSHATGLPRHMNSFASQGSFNRPRPQSVYHEPSPRPSAEFAERRSSSIQSFDRSSRMQSPQRYDTYEYAEQFAEQVKEEERRVSPSPSPPPPPAHRFAGQPHRNPSIQHERHGSTTPIAPSPGGSRMTPSPLRDAMNDVINSLQDMSTYQHNDHSRSPSPLPDLRENGEVWSPDAFELVRSKSIAERRERASFDGSSYRHHAEPQWATQSENYSVYQDRVSQDHSSYPNTGQDRLSEYEANPGQAQIQRTPSLSLYANDLAPQPPLKGSQAYASSKAASTSNQQDYDEPLLPIIPQSTVRLRRSIHGLHRSNSTINRMQSTKTNVTNLTATSSNTQSSASTQLTSRSIMSGYSAGGFSATSAGSLARRKFEPASGVYGAGGPGSRSMVDLTHRDGSFDVETMSGPSYHESHASYNQPASSMTPDWSQSPAPSAGVLGGMTAPKARRSGFFRKMIDSAKSTARTGAASARSTLGHGGSSRPVSRAGSVSPSKGMFSTPDGVTAIAGGSISRPSSAHSNAAKEMGLGGGAAGHDWMQVRRDVNRSNTLSRKEREERVERSELLGQHPMKPVDLFDDMVDGDEGSDGLPIADPIDFSLSNLALVDKNIRFIQSLPTMVSATSLAQSYVCRPYRSDVQRLRAIFTWVSERITWEEDFDGPVDPRRVIQTKRGSSEEIVLLVRDMCLAVGLHAETVRGYLKAPGEQLDLDSIARSNHWWNAVVVDGEWRILDCALASPTHPRRSAYTSTSSQIAESWYFLARPTQICYTHIPLLPEQQHIVPPLAHEILVALPCAVPAYFKNDIQLAGFDTAMLHLENLEMTHIHVNVPEDVECVAETEARTFARDVDGDCFESGEIAKKRVFAQAEWVGGRKRYTIKAVLPGDDGQGTLKIYSGKRGLMHSVRDIPHPLAFALPLSHIGQNPPYEFHIRHPTPHAQRHDLYVVQPQCSRLVLNNTFVFCVRQHPSSLTHPQTESWGDAMKSINNRATSPNPFARPSSAMSMTSGTVSVTGSSNYSDPSSTGVSGGTAQKPAKLALQSPSQKIIRLTRKQEHASAYSTAPISIGDQDTGLTTIWETVVKIGEKGTWRGLVLADRSARWCVFAEWESA